MICKVCKKKKATLRITKLNGGMVEEHQVCPGCAAEVSKHFRKMNQKNSISLEESKHDVESLLSDLLQLKESGGKLHITGTVPEEEDSVCPSCGLNLSRYRHTFMLGCPDCYDSFGEKIEADIQKAQGCTGHLTEKSEQEERLVSHQAKLAELQEQLNDAVEAEDYAKAAELRDQIAELQGGAKNE